MTKNREPEEYMLEGKVLFYQEKIKAVVSKYNTSNACIKDIIVSSVRFLVTNELAPPLSSDICVSNALSSSWSILNSGHIVVHATAHKEMKS